MSQEPPPTPPPPADGVDARADRGVEAAIGVVLLAGFVFRLPLVLPVVAVLLGLGALAGPRANLFQLVANRLVVPRLPPASRPVSVPASTVRAQDAVIATCCALAALAYFVVAGVGWLLAIVAAVVAIIAATTGVHLGPRVTGRFQP